MAWRGTLAASLVSVSRATGVRASSPISATGCLRPPSSCFGSRRFSYSNSRRLGGLGCTQSLMPLHNTVAGMQLTSHLSNKVRTCYELCHGTFHRTCQDR